MAGLAGAALVGVGAVLVDELDEGGVSAQGVEVGFRFGRRTERWLGLEGGTEVLEGAVGVAGQAPVAGQVVLEEGDTGVGGDGAVEDFDGLGESVGAFVAPSQGDGEVGGAGAEAFGVLEIRQCLVQSTQHAQGFSEEETGFEGEAGPGRLRAEDGEGLLGEVEEQEALGFGEAAFEFGVVRLCSGHAKSPERRPDVAAGNR